MREGSIALASILKIESFSNKPGILAEADTADHYEALAESHRSRPLRLVLHIKVTLEHFEARVPRDALEDA